VGWRTVRPAGLKGQYCAQLLTILQNAGECNINQGSINNNVAVHSPNKFCIAVNYRCVYAGRGSRAVWSDCDNTAGLPVAAAALMNV
jgi:hypothetical protein